MEEELTRRELFKATGVGMSVLGLMNLYGIAHAEEKSSETANPEGTPASKAPTMPESPKSTQSVLPKPVPEYKQLPLPYPYNALEPHIDAETLEIHYSRHHAAYVKNFNFAFQRLEFARTMNDMTFIKHWCKELAFNGSGALLHTLYWNNMSPRGGEPKGEFLSLIEESFGKPDTMLDIFASAAKTVEGSGWAILSYEPFTKRLFALQIEKHNDLTLFGAYPLLVCDVWEHAYYLKYRSARGTYVDHFVKLINWAEVERRYNIVRNITI